MIRHVFQDVSLFYLYLLRFIKVSEHGNIDILCLFKNSIYERGRCFFAEAYNR